MSASLTINLKLPLKSAIVPFVVPFILTAAPVKGSALKASEILPVISRCANKLPENATKKKMESRQKRNEVYLFLIIA